MPYHDGNATGNAFECMKRPSPSMQIVLEKLKQPIPWEKPLLLTSWTDQGVLLLNKALSVRKGLPKSHKHIPWHLVVDNAIKVLQNEDNIVWLLWGNDAKRASKYITNETHFVFTDIHPVAEMYDRKKPEIDRLDLEFMGGFGVCNEFLKSKGIEPINWKI